MTNVDSKSTESKTHNFLTDTHGDTLANVLQEVLRARGHLEHDDEPGQLEQARQRLDAAIAIIASEFVGAK